MSINLHLISDAGEGPSLYQTDSLVTRRAMMVYNAGNSGQLAMDHAYGVYLRYLKEDLRLDEEDLNAHIDMVDAFIAFSTNARFTAL